MMCVVGNLKNGPGVIYKDSDSRKCLEKFFSWTKLDIFEIVFLTEYDYIRKEVSNYVECREIEGL